MLAILSEAQEKNDETLPLKAYLECLLLLCYFLCKLVIFFLLSANKKTKKRVSILPAVASTSDGREIPKIMVPSSEERSPVREGNLIELKPLHDNAQKVIKYVFLKLKVASFKVFIFS